MRNLTTIEKRIQILENRAGLGDDVITEVHLQLMGPNGPERTYVTPCDDEGKAKAQRLKDESPYPDFSVRLIPIELWNGEVTPGPDNPGHKSFRQCATRQLKSVSERFIDGRRDRNVPFSELTLEEWSAHGWKNQALQYIGEAANGLTYAMVELDK